MIKALLISLLTATLAHAQGYVSMDEDYLRAWQIGAGVKDTIRNGLLAEYLFTSDATDTSGNGNHGYAVGSTFSGVASFDGSNDSITISNSFAESYSWSFWLKIRAADSRNDYIIDNSNGAQGNIFRHNNSTYVQYFVFDSDREKGVIDAAYNDLNKWTHWVLTITTDKVNVYRDGIFLKYTDIAPPLIRSTTNTTIGCAYDFVDYSNQQMDNLRIYNRVLTTPEITQLHIEGHD